MQMTFKGTRALIAGGTCDIALCLSKLMISAGLEPILTYRNDHGRSVIENHLTTQRGKFKTVFFELNGNPAESIRSVPGNIDYLVDLAQGDFESLIASVDESAMTDFFHANICGRAKMIKAVSRQMVKQKQGRLLFVSSTAAIRPNQGQGFYTAAKLAGEALYRNLGLELACRGITTVSLQPGYVNAGRGRKYLQHRQIEGTAIPMQFVLDIDSLCRTVLYLLSDAAAGINATCVCMDGGLTSIKQPFSK